MGTLLLFIDVAVASELLVKQAQGRKASRSQKIRLERTMNDIIVLIPVTVLMLIPVSAFVFFLFQQLSVNINVFLFYPSVNFFIKKC